MTTMKHMINLIAAIALSAVLPALTACDDNGYKDMKSPVNPLGESLPALPKVENMHTYKAPLYWSIYEHMRESGNAGKPADECVFTLDQWIEVMDWLKDNFLEYGYDMVCTDGSGTFHAKGDTPYMTHQSDLCFADFVKEAHKRGLRVGIYDNPWWIHCDHDMLIPGTDYTVGSLMYDPDKDRVEYPDKKDIWHEVAVASHPGFREYIDGFFKHYHDLGVDMIRMDFLCWYENGFSRLEADYVGPGYGRAAYAKALAWCAESAKKYGIFLSLVMPNMYNDAELEAQYGNMTRVVGDCWNGTWNFTSNDYRGQSFINWPACRNQFDGFTHWSHLAGKGKVILDGDFTRLNTYNNDAEKEFAISIQLMAGGPIAISDRPSTIGDNARFYTNREMLALNADRFVGHPIDDTLNSPGSNIWYGTMSNGDVVVGFFNRDDLAKTMQLDLSQIGLSGEWKVRDLWRHTDESPTSLLSAEIPPRGCKIMKLSK